MKQKEKLKHLKKIKDQFLSRFWIFSMTRFKIETNNGCIESCYDSKVAVFITDSDVLFIDKARFCC